jgi:hypothetical protein
VEYDTYADSIDWSVGRRYASNAVLKPTFVPVAEFWGIAAGMVFSRTFRPT